MEISHFQALKIFYNNPENINDVKVDLFTRGDFFLVEVNSQKEEVGKILNGLNLTVDV